MNKTRIEWCDFTANYVHGCKRGCSFCYAEKIAKRFHKVFGDFKKPHWVQNNYNKPLPKKPSRIFINSMSDPEYWKLEWTKKIIFKIRENPQHTFIILTKGLSYRDFEDPLKQWLPDNLLYGMTITNQSELKKWHSTNSYDCAPYFFSIEPILERIDLSFMDSIKYDWQSFKPLWIIVGAESGNRKGKVIPRLEWIIDIVNYCQHYNIPLFMKDSLKPIYGDLIQEFPK